MIHISKNAGKIFEEEFKDSIDDSIIYYERIKDPAASFGQDSEKTRFSTNNPYDSYAYKYPHFFALELKSTKEKSVQFSLTDNKKQIKKCQIDGLNRAALFDGIISGFIFNFRSEELTFFLNINKFNKFSMETKKKSINIGDVIKYGGVVIPQRKKKVRYIYDTDALFNMTGDKNE